MQPSDWKITLYPEVDLFQLCWKCIQFLYKKIKFYSTKYNIRTKNVDKIVLATVVLYHFLKNHNFMTNRSIRFLSTVWCSSCLRMASLFRELFANLFVPPNGTFIIPTGSRVHRAEIMFPSFFFWIYLFF